MCEKGNKLIAEFMGFVELKKKRPESDMNWLIPTDEYSKFGCSFGYDCSDELQFHDSWDWLMPVISKIQEMYDTEDMFGVLISISTIDVRITGQGFRYIDDKSQKDWKPFDINRVYKAVVEFVKWYNEQ